MGTMKFISTGWRGVAPLRPNTVYLQHTDWDDWFKFATTYAALYVDQDGERHRLGETKIGRFGLKPAGRGSGIAGEARHPGPPDEFTKLPRALFSLAQDPSFYETFSQVYATSHTCRTRSRRRRTRKSLGYRYCATSPC